MALEVALLATFVVCWLLALLAFLLGMPLAGWLDLGLYQLYGLAAFLGWLAGNVYVHRTRGLPRPVRRLVLLVYLFGPQALLYLLRGLAPLAAQRAVPLAAVYASAVFTILFLVPVTLRRSARPLGR